MGGLNTHSQSTFGPGFGHAYNRGVNIKAILLDLDGVLYVGDQVIAGAAAAVRSLQQLGLALAGVTNTTTQSRRDLAQKLARMDIPLSEAQIHTPAALAVSTIDGGSAHLYIRPTLREDFAGIREVQEQPDFVVMGDIGGEGYPPHILRDIFLEVMGGAELLALHKNRFWQKPDGLHLDLGVFVAAVEYATGKEAVVLGKPAREFYHGICRQLGVEPACTLMVGDDIESDIGGAKEAGLATMLVQTGKYREDFVHRTGITADLTVPTIADVPTAVHRMMG